MLNANGFTTYCIDKWEKFEKYNFPNWIFRGQRDANWTFKSSLQRLCESMDIELEYAYIIERTLASEFKRRFHQYSKYHPDGNDNLEWLSIMRHHMAPTRLLDWNYSIYIAAYFALERVSAKEGAAVWALNYEWARRESKRIWLKNGKKEKYLGTPPEPLGKIRGPLHFKNLFLDKPFTNTACPVSPNRLTERLTAQKGLFLCAGNPNITFDENIQAMTGFKEENNIIRLIIPREQRKKYLKKLFESNITHTTLFPGLDGFSNSLSVYLYSFEKDILEKSPYEKDDSVWTF